MLNILNYLLLKQNNINKASNFKLKIYLLSMSGVSVYPLATL